MKTILYIIQKEFKQIFRNKGLLPLLFLMPVIQLLILSNAASFEVKNIRIAVVDSNNSSESRELIDKFRASNYFNKVQFFPSMATAQTEMEKGNIDVYISIPYNFDKELYKQKTASVAVTINAIDGATAGITNVYITQIIRSYNLKVQQQMWTENPTKPSNINTIPSFWYNQTLNYKTYMVPGILVLLVTMLTLFLSSMNIVREKEIGTLEQINVTPIKKRQFIIGKLFPFWIIGLVILSIGFIIAKVVFAVPMLGNLLIIYMFTSIYLWVILGLGLFISNYTDTQQQAMFIAWFLMVIFILMSGLFTPIESMPQWAQNITLFNPIRYFVEVMRNVLLKGAGIADIQKQIWVLLFYALVLNTLAIRSYKKAI